ncbi:hypothetical protein PanWU01x14_134290, partial [Parasponia andersonii]
ARLPRITLNALSGSGVVSCFPLYSGGRPLGFPTPPNCRGKGHCVQVEDPWGFPLYSGGRPLGLPTPPNCRGKGHCIQVEDSWGIRPPAVEVRVGLGQNYPGSVMGSAQTSDGPMADCEITCDPRGL